MEIDENLIKHVAKVARLDLTEEETKKFVPQLKEILEYFELIGDAETEDTEPSFQPIRIRNALREDTIEESLSQEEALSTSEHTKDGYFKGPSAL